ncbi:UNVERIFIED_CONTAM: hypothetical protein GTU68_056014, partial [Idotea baltica]|nr:hypothetical protein [Idotea baltica]
TFNIEKVRADFPILKRTVNGKPLVYFDNAATSQKPQRVIDAINHYYADINSNVHRGVHTLSQTATDAYEEARRVVQRFVNAKSDVEINFTKGTTESINLVAHGFGRKFINEGDEIIISSLEHHSNIVPWQMICEERGAILKVIPINEKGEIIFEEYLKLLSEKTKLVSIVYISNSLGTINPVEQIIEAAHNIGAKVFLDAAQAVPHQKVDVQKLDCDFLAFSGHKLFGPTGTGVLYGKQEILEAMLPYQGGGEMIKDVSFEKTTYNELPFKFEAGTPNIAGGIVLAEAINYVNDLGWENVAAHEQELLEYGTEKLSAIEGLRIIGTADKKASVISFVIEGTHPYDLGVILDKMGIAVRTGHHCCQPLMGIFNIEGTARASFSFYNTKEEIDLLVDGINRAKRMLL